MVPIEQNIIIEWDIPVDENAEFMTSYEPTDVNPEDQENETFLCFGNRRKEKNKQGELLNIWTSTYRLWAPIKDCIKDWKIEKVQSYLDSCTLTFEMMGYIPKHIVASTKINKKKTHEEEEFVITCTDIDHLNWKKFMTQLTNTSCVVGQRYYMTPCAGTCSKQFVGDKHEADSGTYFYISISICYSFKYTNTFIF